MGAYIVHESTELYRTGIVQVQRAKYGGLPTMGARIERLRRDVISILPCNRMDLSVRCAREDALLRRRERSDGILEAS